MAFCPYCGKNVTVDNILRETSNKFLKSRDEIMYSCPHCGRILSMGLD
jgi:predicted  nucleic acid-binding Zn-ribbon protein